MNQRILWLETYDKNVRIVLTSIKCSKIVLYGRENFFILNQYFHNIYVITLTSKFKETSVRKFTGYNLLLLDNYYHMSCSNQ